MRNRILILLIITSLSCENKAMQGDSTLDTAPDERLMTDKNPTVDKNLVGEWTVRGSCDGSIMCNACPRISFRIDGSGWTANTVGGVQNFRWEVVNRRLTIINFDESSIVDDGEYRITYEELESSIQLTLVEVTNSDCYKLTGRTPIY